MVNFLSFSDAAKFADIARNFVLGQGYGSAFSFWSASIFKHLNQSVFPVFDPPFMPLSIAVFFKIFGVSDAAVVTTSFFYFVLTLVSVFLLSKKIFKSNLIGILSVLAVGFNTDMLNYATSGASEAPFIFEIVTTVFLAAQKKKWATILMAVFMGLMYFTRPQAFIYIAGIALFWLLSNFKIKKALGIFVLILVAGIIFDRLVLLPFNGKMFLYTITGRGITSALAQASSTSTSDALRGVVINSGFHGMLQVFKNIFYNLYNFYKLLPQIMSPYLFTVFLIGLFIREKNKPAEVFKFSVAFITALSFLVAAASIPFFRYLHPVVPLIYIAAVGVLVDMLNMIFAKQRLVVPVSMFLILVFGVGQTLGILILDSRFVGNTHNIGKPPVYVVLSQILRENTDKNDLIVTNLDTWGSWYGERKTVWYPLEPEQLIDPVSGTIPFDAVYLTSYLIDDQNYYMGAGWRQIFDNPDNPKKWLCNGCGKLAQEFVVKSAYIVDSGDDYEKQGAHALLLVRRK